MDEKRKKEWLAQKQAQYEFEQSNKRSNDMARAGAKMQALLHAREADPNNVAEPEFYNAEKVAKVLSDYQKEILEDLMGNEKAYVFCDDSMVELETKLGNLKRYENDYTPAFVQLMASNLVDTIDEEETMWRPTWRAELVLKEANKLKSIEEEHQKPLHGIKSLYDFGDFNNRG